MRVHCFSVLKYSSMVHLLSYRLTVSMAPWRSGFASLDSSSHDSRRPPFGGVVVSLASTAVTGRVWRLRPGGLQLDACDADLRLRGPRRAGPHGLPPTRPGDPAARRDVDGARPGGGQPGDVLHEVHHLTAGDDGAAGRGAGTHQQPGRGGVLPPGPRTCPICRPRGRRR